MIGVVTSSGCSKRKTLMISVVAMLNYCNIEVMIVVSLVITTIKKVWLVLDCCRFNVLCLLFPFVLLPW